MAALARTIRDRITTTLAIETKRGPLNTLMKAFQAALVHDLAAEGFADMYAQTIAYGLLSARIADPHKKTVDDFASHMRTNPLLRDLMETFLQVGGRHTKPGAEEIDFDELGVAEVVELLDNANMEAVVRDFGDRNPREDPVIHFYELFPEGVRRGETNAARRVLHAAPGGLLHRPLRACRAAERVRAEGWPCGHRDVGGDGRAPRGPAHP